MSTWRKCLLVVVSIAPFAFAFRDAPGATGMTIDEAIRKALEISPTVMVAQAETSMAIGFEKEMRAPLLPQVSIDGGAGGAYRDRDIVTGTPGSAEWLFSRRIGITVRKLLWDNGYSKNIWLDAKQRTLAEKYLEKNDQEAIALLATEAFIDVDRAREQIFYARENIKVHSEILKLAEERSDSAGNQADVELAKARLNLAKTLLEERILDLEQATSRFVHYVGIEPPSSLVMPAVPSISSMDEVSATGNWQYRGGIELFEAAKYARRAAEGRYSPRLTLEGKGAIGENDQGIEGSDNEASGLLVGEWPIYEGGRKDGLLEQEIAEIERQEALLNENLGTLRQDIRSRWKDYSTIGKRVTSVQDYSSQLKVVVKLYEQQFELGRRPLLSMLDVKNEELSASIRLSDERHDWALLGFRLWALSGQLVSNTVGDAPIAAYPQEYVMEIPAGKDVAEQEATVEIEETKEVNNEKRKFGIFRGSSSSTVSPKPFFNKN